MFIYFIKEFIKDYQNVEKIYLSGEWPRNDKLILVEDMYKPGKLHIKIQKIENEW